MLTLSRKIGEKIVIGENITLTVVEVYRNRVVLGFDAPIEVGIWREELCCEHDESAELGEDNV